MKVDASNLQFASARIATRSSTEQTSLRAWVGDRRPDFERSGVGAAAPAVSISPAAEALAGADSPDAAQAIEDAAAAVESDPRMRLILSLIELLTGRPARTLRADAKGADAAPRPSPSPQAQPTPQAPPRAGFGIEYDQHTVYEETESTHFAAEGLVRTADGQEIRFQITLDMQRSYREESSVSVRLGDAVFKDPLVLNFAGTAAELQSQRFAFDLDADGSREGVPLLGQGSGYLALDLNGDRRIDSGRELFGARTGDGFAELAQHDADGNGWIDERDPVYQRLQLWAPDAAGRGSLTSLKDAGVGAIALAHVATPFALRDAQNQSLGAIRASGVYLGERGGVGTVQQIDVSV